MMGDVIEISPSPELEPQTIYRPLRRKRDPLFLPDENESAIELTDSTDSQNSTPCKRVKRRKETVEPGASTSTSLENPVTRSRALSPRVIGRAGNTRGQTKTLRKASAVSRRTNSPDQTPRAYSTSVPEKEPRALHTRGSTPPAIPGSSRGPNHQPTPPVEHILPGDEPPLAVIADASEVVKESHEKLVEQVREVVPDVLPAHVFELLSTQENTFPKHLLDVVINILLEDRSYPKDVKGKAKARVAEKKTEDISEDIDTNMDYTLLDASRRLGSVYQKLSLQGLRSNFPDLDHMYIHDILSLHDGHYAPTYLYLLHQGATPSSIVPVVPSLGKRKGKAKKKSSLDEEEFMKEHAWLVQRLANRRGSPVPDTTSQDMEEEAEEEGEGEDIECGCCFSSYPFSKMAQCTDTHLFCKSCVTSYASAKLGEQNADFCCMDISGCKMLFPDSELRRVLPEKLFDLYEQIRQRRDIELAELEGLEECPFCDYKVVMDVDFQTDKVLRCQNEECGKVSCRRCKKEDHLPKSCEEMEEDKKLDGKHAIEEAMTRALMRNCPKCQKGFVKEYGCNKMTCTYCHTMSCYVCRSIIKGYEHFDQSRPRHAQRPGSSSKKCPLWDTGEDRHANEVTIAADKALKEYKSLHPDVRDEDIRVELPPAPRSDMHIQHAPGRGHGFPPPPAYVQVHHAHNAHVPIAHPVVAIPFPALAAPPLNFERLFARGPLDIDELHQRLPPRHDVPVMQPMPVPPYNYPLRAPPLPPRDPLQGLPPVPMLQPPAPPVQMPAIPGSRRVPARGKRTGRR